MKRRNPYPGITRTVDRHGKVRWRFRMKGRKSCYIYEQYGSKEFEVAYNLARDGKNIITTSKQVAHGSVDWVIERYKRTPDWHDLGPVFKRNLGYQIERFRIEHGHRIIKDMKREHVESILSRKRETPAAANEVLKLIRRLCAFAIRLDLMKVDPSKGIRKLKTNPDGFHTWTEEEIQKFELRHGIESKAVLAMRLMLYTGAAKQDAAAMGWQNVSYNRISYKRGKTGGNVDLPILPGLTEVLSLVPRDQMLFVLNAFGKPFNANTFGNWFSDQCVKAGIKGRAHGLRKAGATRLANAGGTEFEVMAFLGHATPQEASTYTKKANRSILADTGMAKLENLPNHVTRLDNRAPKYLKNKEK